MNQRYPVTMSIACGLAGILLAGCGSKSDASSGVAAGKAEKRAPTITAVRVEAAVVESSVPVIRVTRPGEVTGAREAHLAAALGGFVEAVKVKSGDQVTTNQVIAFVDTGVHRAQANLTQVELDDAEREMKRVEQLGTAIARVRVDAAATRLARARAQHALSQTQLARAVIRAPFAGVIVNLELERGEVAVPGAPIARVIKLDPIHISVSVTDHDVSILRPGGTAEVSTAGTAQPVVGTIAKIEPAADLETRTFLIEVEVPNPDRVLLPGMMAQVSFETRWEDESLIIPQEFLVTRRAGNGVFVVDEQSVARWRPLTLGRIIATQVEVTAGLSPGERVVILGQRGLADGDHLLVTREGTCCRDGRVFYTQTSALDSRTRPGQNSPQSAPGSGQSGDLPSDEASAGQEAAGQEEMKP